MLISLIDIHIHIIVVTELLFIIHLSDSSRIYILSIPSSFLSVGVNLGVFGLLSVVLLLTDPTPSIHLSVLRLRPRHNFSKLQILSAVFTNLSFTLLLYHLARRHHVSRRVVVVVASIANAAAAAGSVATTHRGRLPSFRRRAEETNQ